MADLKAASQLLDKAYSKADTALKKLDDDALYEVYKEVLAIYKQT